MTAESKRARHGRLRFAAMFAAGAAAAAMTGVVGSWTYAAAVGWAVAALVYDVWVWTVISGMDAERTRRHATAEDPSAGTRDLLILVANVGSLVAVGLVLVESGNTQGTAKAFLALLAIGTVGVSWLLVHTLYTLRYASQYYGGEKPGGIDFNQHEPPNYLDIAYMAFSLGMTYQVSDTAIRTSAIRTTALKHSVLAFVFGMVILATTINLVVGLAQ